MNMELRDVAVAMNMEMRDVAVAMNMEMRDVAVAINMEMRDVAVAMNMEMRDVAGVAMNMVMRDVHRCLPHVVPQPERSAAAPLLPGVQWSLHWKFLSVLVLAVQSFFGGDESPIWTSLQLLASCGDHGLPQKCLIVHVFQHLQKRHLLMRSL